eukprot:m.112154 g.112154  ORF g.112154 m.112154 type:complete len:58 (-) comp13469_c1_seq11:945-1118(-)
METTRRKLIDKMYEEVLKAVLDRIESAKKNSKHANILLFENYHSLYGKLFIPTIATC